MIRWTNEKIQNIFILFAKNLSLILIRKLVRKEALKNLSNNI